MNKSTIAVASALLLSSLLLGACGTKQTSTSSNSSSAAKTSKATQQNQIVGSFKDNKDGAAITFNSDGTGQYVYADSDNPDTNDQLTWKKSGNNYTVNLKDSNVTSPLTAKLSGNQLTLSGDSNWNTEVLTKTKNKLNLNQFLTQAHKKSNQGSQKAKTNSNDSQSLSFDSAAKLIQKGGFTDFDYDNAQEMHDGSHATANGGYEMITYPGAKGEDKFTITKTGTNKYHIQAQYGSIDSGSFTPFDDQSSYGPTSANVSK